MSNDNGCPRANSTLAAAQPANQDAGVALGLEVGEHDGQRLANHPSTVHRQPVVTPQCQPGMLKI